MMTVGFLPWWPANPYQILLKQELKKLGGRVIGNPPLSLLRLLIGRDGLDVVHVHWPHGTYKTLPQMLYVLTLLIAYRLLKNNIVWTVHELDAYESKHPRRDAWFRSMVMRLSRRLIVHGEHTLHELTAQHGYKRPIDLARHPSYVGWYKDEVSREQARLKLGLASNARVYLYFGYIKPYKGVEELIGAFRKLPEDNAVLLIAGKPLDMETKETIEGLAKADARIRTLLGYVADDDLQFYFNAADIVVFPFRHTQTSGSVMLALSFGRAVIVPKIATLPEYVDDASGIFFNPSIEDGLAKALRQAAHAPLDVMGRNARRLAAMTTWEEMAATHMNIYKAVLK
jgi:beta-1,4-mannosyltransferase